MRTQKMSLANIQGKLSRAEMKNIMAGSGTNTGCLTDRTSSGSGMKCKATTTSCTCGGTGGDNPSCMKA